MCPIENYKKMFMFPHLCREAGLKTEYLMAWKLKKYKILIDSELSYYISFYREREGDEERGVNVNGDVEYLDHKVNNK